MTSPASAALSLRVQPPPSSPSPSSPSTCSLPTSLASNSTSIAVLDMSSGVWQSDAQVSISVGSHGASARVPTTVGAVFRATVARYGDRPALRVKRDGAYVQWTWREYYADCCRFARALIHLGVPAHSAVGILGFNAPEWLIADVGTILAGGMAAGIYGSNGPDACRYISAHSSAPVVVVDSTAQLDKFLQVLPDLPHLVALIAWGIPGLDGDQELHDRVRRVSSGRTALYSFQAFLSLGELHDTGKSDPLDDRMDAQRPGHCCTLVYTSGTTGPPKAVMTSHDNVTWMSSTVPDVFPGIGAHSRAVSFLPLSHVAAQMMDVHLPMLLGCPLTFAAPNALKGGGLLETLTDVRPSFILAVPRVWEKIMEALEAKLKAEQSKVKRALVAWAFRQGTRRMHRLQHHKTAEEEEKASQMSWWAWIAGVWDWVLGFQYVLANALLLRKIRVAMGLNDCHYCVSGAAPIAADVFAFYGQLGISLYECFGQSETTGPHTSTSVGRWRIGTTGPAWPGTTCRLDPDTGEVQSRGRQVFMGYLSDQESTEKALLPDGWFASGDIGEFDKHGYLSITGRLKDLIITAGGENIPPSLIEDALSCEMPALSHVVVIGDRRKYLTFLCSLRVKPDEHGAPTDVLDHVALDELKQAGSAAKTVTEARECAHVRKYIEAGMKRANARAVSNAQRVQKFLLLPRDLSLDSGELTPTLKIKRAVVVKQHQAEIDSLYA